MGFLKNALGGATQAIVREILAELHKEIQKADVMQDTSLAKTLRVIYGVVERTLLK